MIASIGAATDAAWMARALGLARRGAYTTRPNPAVGCVLVKDNEAVGEGWHRRAGEPHAEALALALAGERARGSTCYVTLEPCAHHGRTPPCADALIAAGVARVVAAGVDPDPRVSGRGVASLRRAGIAVDTGVLEAAAADLNRGFMARMRLGRPYVRAKIAASLDGRTALANGASQWITSAAARRDVHRLRAAAGAVLTGIGTVLADDPELTARDIDFDLAAGQPLRVVADSNLRTPPAAKLIRRGGAVIVGGGTIEARVRLEQAGARVLTTVMAGGRIGLAALLGQLAQWEINDVLVEAGPTLTGELFRLGLVDELIVYLAPRLLGDRARAMIGLPLLEDLTAAAQLRLVEERRVGPDLRLLFHPGQNPNPVP